MKNQNQFIRILSPITLIVIGVLDIAVICYGVFAVKKLLEVISFVTITFAILEFAAIIIAFFVTKSMFNNGIKFTDTNMEFTGIDNDNIFEFADIENVKVEKDDKASFVKNFVDRYSKVIITLKDETVITVNLGLTTKKTLLKVKKIIDEHIEK